MIKTLREHHQHLRSNLANKLTASWGSFMGEAVMQSTPHILRYFTMPSNIPSTTNFRSPTSNFSPERRLITATGSPNMLTIARRLLPVVADETTCWSTSRVKETAAKSSLGVTVKSQSEAIVIKVTNT